MKIKTPIIFTGKRAFGLFIIINNAIIKSATKKTAVINLAVNDKEDARKFILLSPLIKSFDLY